jgi:hypothetical protein
MDVSEPSPAIHQLRRKSAQKPQLNEPLIGACYNRRLDLIYLQDPDLYTGEQFPLWSIY